MLASGLSYSQTNVENNDNVFQQAESSEASASNTPVMQEEAGANPPPGDDELPIDNYIPVLLIISVGLIMHQHYKKKLTSK